MKLKVTNNTGRAYGVNALIDGFPQVVELAAGEAWEGEFDDNEATALNKREGWAVEGYTEPKQTATKTDVAADVSQITKERDDARATLKDIANLFGTPDVDELNVRSAVERLIQDSKRTDTSGQTTDLAAAVALLDDTNDDHWTDAGKPSIEALKQLTGGNVTRAQVDALPTQRERQK